MRNERGSVLIFVTLMITVLLVTVGMGLDTGQLTYTRNMGQAAVDSAALAAVTGITSGSIDQVRSRATGFNGSNNYTGSTATQIRGANVTLVEYNFEDGSMKAAASIATANGTRVALETSNPYDAGATNTPMKTPTFLTPLFNLLGVPMSQTKNVNVSAVAVVNAIHTLPIAVYNTQCSKPNPIRIRATSDPLESGCWTTFFDQSTAVPDVIGLMQAAGDCKRTATGVQNGSIIHLNDGTQQPNFVAADDLFKAHPNKCWLVPVIAAPSVDAKSNNCNQWQEILDFAKICPTQVVTTGNPKYIEANITCNQDPIRTTDSICYSHRLVRDKLSGM